MLKKIKEIAQGYYNLFTGNEEELINNRLEICTVCEYNSTPNEITNVSYCKSCGCGLKAKAASPDSSCPKGYWNAHRSTNKS